MELWALCPFPSSEGEFVPEEDPAACSDAGNEVFGAGPGTPQTPCAVSRTPPLQRGSKWEAITVLSFSWESPLKLSLRFSPAGLGFAPAVQRADFHTGTHLIPSPATPVLVHGPLGQGSPQIQHLCISPI